MNGCDNGVIARLKSVYRHSKVFLTIFIILSCCCVHVAECAGESRWPPPVPVHGGNVAAAAAAVSHRWAQHRRASELYSGQCFLRCPCLFSDQTLTCHWLWSRSHTPGSGTMSGARVLIWPWDDAGVCSLAAFQWKRNMRPDYPPPLSFTAKRTRVVLAASEPSLPRLLFKLLNLLAICWRWKEVIKAIKQNKKAAYRAFCLWQPNRLDLVKLTIERLSSTYCI